MLGSGVQLCEPAFYSNSNACCTTYPHRRIHVLRFWAQQTPHPKKQLKPSHLWLNEEYETSCVAEGWIHSDAKLRTNTLERLLSYEQSSCEDFRPEFFSLWETAIFGNRWTDWLVCKYNPFPGHKILLFIKAVCFPMLFGPNKFASSLRVPGV